jgi:hypothetical protein
LEGTGALTASLVAGNPLGVNAYAKANGQSRKVRTKAKAAEEALALERLCSKASAADSRRMLRSRETGAWLTTMPDSQNGTELSVDEFRDSLRLRFGLVPASLPHRCDGCTERFSVEHAMKCKRGGLVTLRHNDVQAEWEHLCATALTPSAVSDEPLLQTGRDVQRAGAQGTEPIPELRGDVAVHGFWKRGTTAIFDVRVTDTDTPSAKGMDPLKVLRRHETEKKKKYNALCLARRKTFTPLVFSVDGMRGPEGSAASKRLAVLLSAKWKQTYSTVCGYVRSRLSMALVRSASRCLRADRSPKVRLPTAAWETGTGLALYR